jgi:hypothetical protein
VRSLCLCHRAARACACAAQRPGRTVAAGELPAPSVSEIQRGLLVARPPARTLCSLWVPYARIAPTHGQRSGQSCRCSLVCSWFVVIYSSNVFFSLFIYYVRVLRLRVSMYDYEQLQVYGLFTGFGLIYPHHAILSANQGTPRTRGRTGHRPRHLHGMIERAVRCYTVKVSAESAGAVASNVFLESLTTDKAGPTRTT